MEIKRIGINTGGGDAPGLNAVIRAIVLAAVQRGWEGSSTVPVFHGRGEVAVEAKPRKLILSPAAVFDQLAAEVPQFAGHSHLSLIRSKGANLV